MRNKILSLLLALTLSLGLFPAQALAAETEPPVEEAPPIEEALPTEDETPAEEATDEDKSIIEEVSLEGDQTDSASGTCGENLTWSYSNGTLSIQGAGWMADYGNTEFVPWYNSYHSQIKAVIIGYGVTTIGATAFSYCHSLTSIDIPDSVTGIRLSAFFGCNSLTSIDIPDSVTTIGEGAFVDCSSLTSVDIPNSVTNIEAYTFDGCNSLTSLIISSNVTSIGSYAFNGCTSLTDVYYSGTESQWNAISINNYNDPLKNATIHYNSVGPSESAKPVAVVTSDNGHRYELYDIGMTWIEAKAYCENLDGHLVSITSNQEQQLIESLLEKGSKYQYWLGLSYLNGNMTWVTGEPYSYANWDKNQPDHAYRLDGQRESYIQIYNMANPGVSESERFGWNDNFVDNTRSQDQEEKKFFSLQTIGFICEYEPDTPAGDIVIDNGNSSRTIKVGETISLPVSVPNPNGLSLDDITFTSSDEEVVAPPSVKNRFDLTEMKLLSFTLNVSGLKAGTATITASAPDGRSASCEVNIMPSGTIPAHVSALLPVPNSKLSLQDIWAGHNLQFSLKFRKKIKPGSGKVYLKDYETDKIIKIAEFDPEDFSAASMNRLECDNDTLKISFSTSDAEYPIPDGRKLYIIVEPDAILFEDGNLFDGISNKDVWYVNTEFGLTKYEENARFSNEAIDFFHSGERKTYPIASQTLQEQLEKIIGKTGLIWHMNQKFSGACFGTSVVTALYKAGIIDLTEFDSEAVNLYHMKFPKDSTHAYGVRDLINYYFLLQHADYYKISGLNTLCASVFRDKDDFSGTLRDIVNLGLNMEQDQRVLVMNYGWMEGTCSHMHSVVLCSAKKNEDDSYSLIVKDPEISESLREMKVSSDFSRLTDKSDTGDLSVVIVKTIDVTTIPSNWLIQEKSFVPDVALLTSMKEDAQDYDILKVVAYGNFTITNSSGETLVYENGNLSGTMEIFDEDFVESGVEDYTEFVYYVPKSAGYTFQSSDSRSGCTVLDGNQYLSVSAENATNITLNKAQGISVQGSDLVYDAYTTTATGSNMFAISGETGSNLEISLAADGSAEVTADSMENIAFQSLYDDTAFVFDSNTNTAKIVETERGSLTLNDVEIHRQTLFSTSLRDAGDSVEATITNNTAVPQTATVLIAVYRPSGQFIRTDIKKLDFEGNQTLTFALTERNVEFKLFVADDPSSWEPVGSSARFSMGE